MDSFTGHKLTVQAEKALERSRTELQFFPECATDPVQPAVSFVIQCIELKLKARWDPQLI